MKDIVVILHSIRSIHNVGSIFRTADAACVKKMYLSGITPSPLDRFGALRPQFTKVALGAEKYVPYEKTKSTTRLIDTLKNEGYKIFAIEQSPKSVPYYKLRKPFDYTQGKNKLALVFGNEVRGLTPAILKRADKILEIPMKGKKESLNVAVAFGIVVYRLLY